MRDGSSDGHEVYRTESGFRFVNLSPPGGHAESDRCVLVRLAPDAEESLTDPYACNLDRRVRLALVGTRSTVRWCDERRELLSARRTAREGGASVSRFPVIKWTSPSPPVKGNAAEQATFEFDGCRWRFSVGSAFVQGRSMWEATVEISGLRPSDTWLDIAKMHGLVNSRDARRACLKLRRAWDLLMAPYDWPNREQPFVGRPRAGKSS